MTHQGLAGVTGEEDGGGALVNLVALLSVCVVDHDESVLIGQGLCGKPWSQTQQIISTGESWRRAFREKSLFPNTFSKTTKTITASSKRGKTPSHRMWQSAEPPLGSGSR